MKKILIYITIIVGVLFACTIDNLFIHPISGVLGGLFLLLILIDYFTLSREDMEKFFHDDKIKE